MSTQENVKWSHNTPESTQFKDVYYSTTDGLAETENVFILGNQLPQRCLNQQHFVIAETGFGTGLNFVATIALWLKTAPQHAQLDYISVEKYPLSKRSIKKALSQWPELDIYTRALLQVYPVNISGFHRSKLVKNRISLTLMIGDATEMYSQLSTEVDAWYLDGFAPNRNPEMWSAELCKEIARLSHPGTSFSTYTAAGQVRRNLQQAGFTVKKVTGHEKRERLCGHFNQASSVISSAPWFHPPKIAVPDRKKAIIIGGGIAGVSMAHTLCQSGWQATLLEQEDHIAAQASGNKAGIVMPKLTLNMDDYAQFHLSAFLYTIKWLQGIQARQPSLEWHPDGILELVGQQRGTQLAKLDLNKQVVQYLTTKSASRLAGVPLEKEALYYPQAGWLAPAQLCKTLLEDCPTIHIACNHTVLDLQQQADHTWQVITQKQSYKAEVVVICNGPAANQFWQTQHLPITPSRGQISYLRQSGHPPTLLKAICYGGYVIPLTENELVCGASYAPGDNVATLRQADHDDNTRTLQQHLPGLIADQQPVQDGRVAIRATTLDRLPIVGPVANEAFYQLAYQDIRLGKKPSVYPLAQYHPGLYIASGLGSRGLTTAAITAELIANLVNNTPLALSTALYHAVHPARFFIRALRKQQSPTTN